jgi:hypothetical protein
MGKSKGRDRSLRGVKRRREANPVVLAVLALAVLAIMGYPVLCSKEMPLAGTGLCIFESGLDTATDYIGELKNKTLEELKNKTMEDILLFEPKKNDSESYLPPVISIVSWNLDPLTLDDLENKPLADYYLGHMRDFDIVVVLGLRDPSGQAWNMVCDMMADYECISSSHTSETERDHRYGILYKDVELVGVQDWNVGIHKQTFTAPPYAAHFKANEWVFKIVAFHADPERMEAELQGLERINILDSFSGDKVVAGTFYADCNGYKNLRESLPGWDWSLIEVKNHSETGKICEYHGLGNNPFAKNNYITYGIRGAGSNQTEHHIVYATYKTTEE